MCYYIDDIIKIEDFDINQSKDFNTWKVITYVIYHYYAKIEDDSFGSLV